MKDAIKTHRTFLLFSALVVVYLLFYLPWGICQERESSKLRKALTPRVGSTDILSATFSFDRAIYFKNQEYIIKEKDTLVDLAVRFGVGYQHLVLANPEVDPWVPEPGQGIIIPYQVLVPPDFLYPEVTYILINFPEMRLYFFQGSELFILPVGIADEGKATPEGNYKIIRKQKSPTWYPPPSVLVEDPSLPKVVPPGPDNPLGEYALYLDRGLYVIHGTNKEESVGRRTTHGCFRLYRDHIAFLYQRVPINTPVFITYRPFKIAVEGGKIYLQAYPDIEKRIKDPFHQILNSISSFAKLQGADFQINLFKLEEALERLDGLVYEIGDFKVSAVQAFSSREKSKGTISPLLQPTLYSIGF